MESRGEGGMDDWIEDGIEFRCATVEEFCSLCHSVLRGEDDSRKGDGERGTGEGDGRNLL